MLNSNKDQPQNRKEARIRQIFLKGNTNCSQKYQKISLTNAMYKILQIINNDTLWTDLVDKK